MRKAWQRTPSILAWRIPWTEEPDGPQSMGSQRVRHNWSDRAHMQTCSWASLVAQLVKNQRANAGDARDLGSIPGLGRSPGKGNGNTPQYSYLGNPMDRGASWATVHGVTELDTVECTRTRTNMLSDASFFPLRIKIIVLRPSGEVYVLT